MWTPTSATPASATFAPFVGWDERAPAPGESPAPWRERRHLVEQNVADIVVGRASITFEEMFAEHHAIYGTVHAQIAGFVVNDWFADAGAELGYRFYAWRGGPHGVFVGPAIFGLEGYSGGTIALESVTGTFTGEKKPWITAFGGAVEAGYKWMSRSGVVFGSSFGVELRGCNRTRSDVAPIAWLFDGTGVRPRLSVAVGKAF